VDITPDTKDWTWVLGSRCAECGFDTRTPRRQDLAPLMEAIATRWIDGIASIDDLRERPRPDVWSALEYACHVRDVFALARYRHALMLGEDDPLFDNWDQDATAVAERYDQQDPGDAVEALVTNAAGYAADLAATSGEQWARPGRRSDGSAFTVESFARYLAHDPIHHLTDVTGTPWA
jgi:hypothetical protein